MKQSFIILAITILFLEYAQGQSQELTPPAKSTVLNRDFKKLAELKNHSAKVYYSHGQETRAASIIQRFDKAMDYHSKMLGFTPAVTFLVLTKADWNDYTDFPVYGMPHYNGDSLLIVAAEDNAFWQSFLPPVDQLEPSLKQQVMQAYRKSDGTISMEPFFDLLALHELGHAFHFQAGLNMQRKWMGELFANILLHTYIAENEPSSLPALTIFPKMVIDAGTNGYTYTKLEDIEARYDEIGKQHPKNYGWYQSRWHAEAGNIYESEGKEVCQNLWKALQSQKDYLNDAQLQELFRNAGASGVANMMRDWDGFVLRNRLH